jgi:hypothetical protein
MTLAPSCGDCAFWSKHGTHDGSCRRAAPQPSDGADQIAHWPVTTDRERCADGRARDPQRNALVTCGQCRFWHTSDQGGLDPQDRQDARREWWNSAGHCVRHAPRPSSNPGARGFWRATSTKDSCSQGELA